MGPSESHNNLMTPRRLIIPILLSLWFVFTVSAAGDEKKVVIGLIGDSTVATTYGWGPPFALRFKEGAAVLNFARDGATLDSLSKKLDALLAEKPDYVLVQFGHNDMKRYGAEAYGQKLSGYVERIRKAGSKPVVLSSVTRRNFDDKGRIAPRVIEGDRTLPAFAKVAKAVSRKAKVPFIDLNSISIEHHNRIGPEASAAYNFNENDKTHFSPEGGAATADLILKELRAAVPELVPWILSRN